MSGHDFTLSGARLSALACGALHWPAQGLLVVSDLHLGKSARRARQGGALLPPYETRETLDRLDTALQHTGAEMVICLGDSFDDLAAATDLPAPDRLRIAAMQAGRRWIWIEGNHDPGPVDLGGAHKAELTVAPLTFRHVASPDGCGEVSGHFHPKAALTVRGRQVTRPAFLIDTERVIMPAFGTYTGGLKSDAPALSRLMGRDAIAVLTGRVPQVMPMPR